jgi:hypothetical protein
VGGVLLSVDEQIAAKLGLSMAQLQEDYQRFAAEEGPPQSRRRIEEVPDGPELQRILALPRRELSNGSELVEGFTAALSTHRGQQRLLPIQALALHEIGDVKGGFLCIVAGGGKTLISYLAPIMMESRRPLLLVPAKLQVETRDKFRVLAQHWRGPHPDAYKIVSFEKLDRPSSGVELDDKGRVVKPGLLETYRPDAIIIDEAQGLARAGRVAVRRLRRYLREFPVPVVAMSGTMTANSLMNYAHIAEWCMPKFCPVPQKYLDLRDWCDYLDDGVKERPKPGALSKLLEFREIGTWDDAEQELEIIRNAYQRRLRQCPGVVMSRECKLEGVELELRPVLAPGCPVIEEHMERLRKEWCVPGSDIPLADYKDLARKARELALGFHYIWVPEAPEEWKAARKEWAAWCRKAIMYNNRDLDSEFQIIDAVRRGIYNDEGRYERWSAVKDTFEPNPVPVWHSNEAFEVAEKWLHSVNGEGMIWTQHSAFGHELGRRLRIPYHGRQGLDDRGNKLQDRKGGAVIASIQSNATGRNLQAWNKALVMSQPRSASTSEQLLARHHRQGQTAPKVSFWIYCASYEHIAGLYLAKEGAKYQQATLGSDQRLLYADWHIPELSFFPKRGWISLDSQQSQAHIG